MHDLNAIAAFVQVIQAGSFSAAAKDLNMPLSTVSRKVSDLENNLQLKLMERSTRRLRLTELGEIYFDYYRRGLEEFQAADLVVENRQNDVSGLLRLALPPNLAGPILTPIISKFQRKYPNARIAVSVAERVVDMVEDSIDLAFRVGPQRDTSLIARKLRTYRHLMVASGQYLADNGTPHRPQDIPNHRVMTFANSPSMMQRWVLHNNGETRQIDFSPVLCINDYAAMKQAALQGQGITELPSILCEEQMATGALVNVLPQWQFQQISLLIVHSGRRNMSRLTRLFLEFCETHIADT